MSIIKKMRKQKATYWEPSGVNDNFGNPLFEQPVEIDCRWEDRVEEYIGPDGEKKLSNSIIYVDRDVKLGGVLLLGDMESGIDEINPLDRDGAVQIKRFESLPNLKNTETLRTVYV